MLNSFEKFPRSRSQIEDNGEGGRREGEERRDGDDAYSASRRHPRMSYVLYGRERNFAIFFPPYVPLYYRFDAARAFFMRQFSLSCRRPIIQARASESERVREKEGR